MRISSATIDCWIWADGFSHMTSHYTDLQHHHWDIVASGTIDHGLMNKPSYTWTCDGNGHDANGSWSASHLSQTSNAQVWINSANTVILKQTLGFGNKQVSATGSTTNTDHPISEPTWPALTWDPNLNTPTSIVFSDGGRPPATFNRMVIVNGKPVRSVVNLPGVGGEDYTDKIQLFQKPAVVRVRAWWSWTISLSS